MQDLEKDFGHLFKAAELEKDAFWGMLGSWARGLGTKAQNFGLGIKNKFTGALDEGKAGFRLARSAVGTGNQVAFDRGMNSALKGFGTAGLMGGTGLIGAYAAGNAIFGSSEMPKTAALKGARMFGKYLGNAARNHVPEIAGVSLLGGAGIYLGNKIRENAIPEVNLLPYLEAREKIWPAGKPSEAQ